MERPHNERNATHAGTIGWLGIAAYVVWFDTTQSESLSHAYSRGLENSRSRPFVLAGLGVTALHLLRLIPPAVDPFYLVVPRPNEPEA
jgi:hypothetical protein